MLESMIPERYLVITDGRFWRILDAWHESLQGVDVFDIDFEVPDNSPAVKTLTDEESRVLVLKMKETGYLDRYYEKLTLPVSKPEKLPKPKSDSLMLKEDAINAIIKIVGLGSTEIVTDKLDSK